MKAVDPIEMAEAPSITLAGKEYKVPKIVARQNRIITPAIFGLMDVFLQAMAAVERHNMMGFTLTEQQFDQLMLIAHTALLRGYPDVTREDMEDWPIETIELLGSLIVIAKQAGCMPKQVPVPLALGGSQDPPKEAPPTG